MIFEIIQNEIAYAKQSVYRKIQATLRKTVASLTIVVASMFFLVLGINFLFLSLFFYWSELPRFVNPALYCGVVQIVLGIILLFIGISISKSE